MSRCYNCLVVSIVLLAIIFGLLYDHLVGDIYFKKRLEKYKNDVPRLIEAIDSEAYRRNYEARCQFHQHFMSSIYTCRSQMRKKTVESCQSFCAFGICMHKSCSKNVDEIDPRGWRGWVNPKGEFRDTSTTNVKETILSAGAEISQPFYLSLFTVPSLPIVKVDCLFRICSD